MLRHKATRSLLFFVALSQSLLAAEEKSVRFDAIGVELMQPEGFAVSQQWQGLEHESGVGVVVMTLPAPLAETTAGFTADRLRAAGMTLHEKTETTIAGKPAVLLNVTQTQEGVEFGKWLAAFGENTTTMIVSSYPKQFEAEFSDLLKSIVVGARAIDVKRAPLGANVDFDVGRSDKLQLASDDNNTLIFTADGTMPQKSPEAPLLVVSKSLGRPEIADLQRFALQRIKQTAETKIAEVERNQTFGSGRLKACETIASGKDESSETSLLVYQQILVDQDCYFVIQGLVGAERRHEFLPIFQKMSKGFRRVRPGESQAVAASASPTGETTGERLAGVGRTRPISPPESTSAPDAPQPFEPHRIPDDRPKEATRSDQGEAPEEASGRRPARAASRRPARPRANRLPRPQAPLASYEYTSDVVRRSPPLGGPNGEPFEDLAPDGGLLVGLRVVRGTDFGGSVQAVEAIFQAAGRYRSSGLRGKQGEDVQLLLAPAGYAVGGLQVGAGAWMDAVRLVYMRVNDNRLVTDSPEYSEWIGGDGGSTSEILSDGSLIVGLSGTFEENLESLELAFVRSDEIKAKSVTPTEKPQGSNWPLMRVWKSANGRFSVSARFKSADDAQVTLVRSDGKEITVPIEKLSVSDREFLRSGANSTGP